VQRYNNITKAQTDWFGREFHSHYILNAIAASTLAGVVY
jgi:hypothetical protein